VGLVISFFYFYKKVGNPFRNPFKIKKDKDSIANLETNKMYVMGHFKWNIIIIYLVILPIAFGLVIFILGELFSFL
jgi:hypothetical protein